MMLELFTEIYELSKAVGVGIEDGFVEKTMAFIDTFPFDTTSSLARDVWEGKPSEIDYQNGTVVSFGPAIWSADAHQQVYLQCYYGLWR
jgi:2-dehydropantoate 2-reductase